MDTIRPFSPHSTQRKISQKELKKIRHNMKKVPMIQQKSDKYHEKQSLQAEKTLQHIFKEKKSSFIANEKSDTQKTKSTLRKKFWGRFIDNFKHKPYT